MKQTKTVDDYLSDAGQWQAELGMLRKILLSCRLTEEIKWGAPCYTYNGKNVVGLGAFKSYFGLWFHQGALLKDSSKVLINAQKGKTKALRQWRMHSADDIKPRIITRYVKESIEQFKDGQAIKASRNEPVSVPPELTSALRRNKGATAAFRELRKGLQREYADYIGAAKREETKRRRIDRILPMITAGIGLNDKYRS
jgi:uncharacterized protein YdeI (YjbR/CyaY-like superfamily)